MVKLIDPLLRTWRWPALAMLASLAMLAAAHGFERFAYMLPCPLCLRQREVYWAAAAMTLTALALWSIRRNPRFLMAFNIMLGLVFLTGAVVAAYHVGVEYKWWPAPSGCLAAPIDLNAVFESIDSGNINQRQGVASCTEDPFQGRWLLSMAGWNMLVSFTLSVLSFRAAGVSLSGGGVLSPAE